MTIPGTAGNNSVVQAQGARLLISAHSPCFGSGSLLWFTPSTDQEQTLISPPRGTEGVIGVVPYGPRPRRSSPWPAAAQVANRPACSPSGWRGPCPRRPQVPGQSGLAAVLAGSLHTRAASIHRRQTAKNVTIQ